MTKSDKIAATIVTNSAEVRAIVARDFPHRCAGYGCRVCWWIVRKHFPESLRE